SAKLVWPSISRSVFVSRLTHDAGDAGTTGGKSSGDRPTSLYVAPAHRRLTLALSVTLSATGAVGSSLTISASFRADTVMAPLDATFAGIATRAPTSRSVAVTRTASLSLSRRTFARLGSVWRGFATVGQI